MLLIGMEWVWHVEDDGIDLVLVRNSARTSPCTVGEGPACGMNRDCGAKHSCSWYIAYKGLDTVAWGANGNWHNV